VELLILISIEFIFLLIKILKSRSISRNIKGDEKYLELALYETAITYYMLFNLKMYIYKEIRWKGFSS
jgi:hypothetical protein